MIEENSLQINKFKGTVQSVNYMLLVLGQIILFEIRLAEKFSALYIFSRKYLGKCKLNNIKTK